MPSDAAATPAELAPARLHPLTLLFAAVNAIRVVIIPAVVILLVGSRRPESGPWWALASIGIAAMSVIYSILHYFTFTYRVRSDELVIRYGILQRTERHIPLDRVQDVRIERGFIHRLLGVSEVQIETAGGQGAEATLSVLSAADAARFRQAIFERAPERAGESPTAAPGAVLRRVTTRELIVAGLTSNHLASGLAIIAGALALLDDFLPTESWSRRFIAFFAVAQHWFEGAGAAAWILALLTALVFLILLGMLISISGSILFFHGFVLSLRGEDLHRAYGLLTRRESSLPRRRIQLLKIIEGPLRRPFDLASLTANTAGSPADEDGQPLNMLVPIAARAELDALLPAIFPDVQSHAPEWQRVSRRAIRRGTAKGALGCALLALALFNLYRSWASLWPLALIPAVYLINLITYHHVGYSLSGSYFRTRRGWLSRLTHIVPVRNVQAVVIRQTPLDRRHGVTTLLVDTAGQAAESAGPRLGNIPVDDALQVARALARQAAGTRYRL